MQPIRIVSRKYDGRLRDEYEAFLYAEDHERLVAYAPVGTMSYDRHKQAWVPAPDGLLEIYFWAVGDRSEDSVQQEAGYPYHSECPRKIFRWNVLQLGASSRFWDRSKQWTSN